MTNTTSRLSQHALYNPDNYREKKYAEKKYATSLSDLANNLEYVSDRVDHTLSKGFIPVCDDHKESTKEPTETLSRPKLTMFDVTQPSLQESLRTDISEEELIKLYEEKIGKLDSISGRPVSPRDSQWYVNPNHLSTTGEAPTLQSIGQTFRNGEKIEQNYSDKDHIALNYFPVTLGSAYELCAEEFPEARPLLSTAPPSMRQSRSRSKQSRPRSKSATGLRRSQTFRDRFDEKQPVEKLYLTTAEAPCIGKYGLVSPSWHTVVGTMFLTPFLIVDLSIFILWMSPFLILGVSGGCFHFYCISIEILVSKQCRP